MSGQEIRVGHAPVPASDHILVTTPISQSFAPTWWVRVRAWIRRNL